MGREEKDRKDRNCVEYFYGIAVGSSERLGFEDQKKLYSRLFINMDIMAKTARQIITDPFYQLHVETYCQHLDREIQETVIYFNDATKRDEFRSVFEDKLQSWITEFNFPTPAEIDYFSEIYSVPFEALLEVTVTCVSQQTATTAVFDDYLSQYSLLLDEVMLNRVLDNMNRVKRISEKSLSPFSSFFPSKQIQKF